MSNMIDMWLSMNSCVRDKNDDIYFVDGGKPQYLGTLDGYSIKDGVLNINVRAKQSIDFINVNVTITKDGVEVEG